MSWDGEMLLIEFVLEEMELVVDIFFGVVCVLGLKFLDDFVFFVLNLLKGIRFVFFYFWLLFMFLVFLLEEEKGKLEEELVLIDDEKDVDLFDVKRILIIVGRIMILMRIVRMVLFMLVVIICVWEVLREVIEFE